MWHDDTFSKRNKVAKKAGGGQAIKGNFIKQWVGNFCQFCTSSVVLDKMWEKSGAAVNMTLKIISKKKIANSMTRIFTNDKHTT